MQRSKI